MGWAAIGWRDSHYQLVDGILLCRLWGPKSSPQHNCIFSVARYRRVTNTFISRVNPCLYSVRLYSLSYQISNKSNALTVQSVPLDEFNHYRYQECSCAHGKSLDVVFLLVDGRPWCYCWQSRRCLKMTAWATALNFKPPFTLVAFHAFPGNFRDTKISVSHFRN